MAVKSALRLVAGTFILISALLAHFVSPWWLLFTAFPGVNLLQSSLTNWCPMVRILRTLGLHDAASRTERGGRACCLTR